MVMESFEDANCHSLSDSFSLYERYMRSFNVVDNIIDENNHREPNEATSSTNENSNGAANIDLSGAIHTTLQSKHCKTADDNLYLVVNDGVVDKESTSLDTASFAKVDSDSLSLAASFDNSSATVERSVLTNKSDLVDIPVSSEESRQEGIKPPVFITSTMENSNNAVDSVPMFHDIRHSESIFKLPISELSFNGTIKHVQKLKPIVDPISAMTSASTSLVLDEKLENQSKYVSLSTSDNSGSSSEQINSCTHKVSDMIIRTSSENKRANPSESTGDSQYEEFNPRKEYQPLMNREISGDKWNADSSSSFEASFDSGVRSPDMFSEDDDIDSQPAPAPEPFWNFIKDYEIYDKKTIRNMEEKLLGVPPPPSITVLSIDVVEMLKKYYCFLPVFTGEVKVGAETSAVTPTKGISLVEIPTQDVIAGIQEPFDTSVKCNDSTQLSLLKENTSTSNEFNRSMSDSSITLKMSSAQDAKETSWPEILKCRYYDIHYNLTKYSEKIELLAQRIGDRYVGAETDTSVCVYSGGLQSPSSACKRKALRLKMAISPGRRLSHLARRRQVFCSAATFNEKIQASTSKFVLIDKKYLSHKKLVNVAAKKSPRTRRTPGKKTPGKLTPIKTPKTKSGGSSRKKVMRRLLMDSDNMTQSQPTRETSKRALFISPENRKVIPTAPSSSQVMKSRRALFGSPVTAETKSMDGTQSDMFLKRKRDALDDEPETNRSKIAKSLSFGGDNIYNSQPLSASQPIHRRASDVVVKSKAELNEIHKKKLLWAVSEALRVHGWRMSSPGFREKASALAQLTRRLLVLPPHAARLASPKLSTSDTMLKIARQYVFQIIQGRTVEECFQDEQTRLANETTTKLTGYISATTYQQLKARQAMASTSTIKENTCNHCPVKQDQPKSASKNILQDKLVNIDSSSNSSSSGISAMDRMGIYKTNSMPSFEEAAKMRARRQISFDNVDFPKR